MMFWLFCRSIANMPPRDLYDVNLIYDPHFWLAYVDMWRRLGYYIPGVDDTESQVYVDDIGDEDSIGNLPDTFDIYFDDFPGSGTQEDPIDLTVEESDTEPESEDD